MEELVSRSDRLTFSGKASERAGLSFGQRRRVLIGIIGGHNSKVDSCWVLDSIDNLLVGQAVLRLISRW